MSFTSTAVPVMVLLLVSPLPALAQRVPFERSYEVGERALVDISTIRGRITVTAGDTRQVVVKGSATVRTGFNVPVNALELARQVAANPPIEQEGATLRLLPPRDDLERRAVTIRYDVTVPRDAALKTDSDSGAVAVRGVGGQVTVETHTGAIELEDLGGRTDVRSGSGAVNVNGVRGDLSVATSSSGIRLRAVGAALQVRTQSGAVDARLVGRGDADVETASSGIELRGVHGGATVMSQSGSVQIRGVPRGPWTIETGSGSITVLFDDDTDVMLDARSRSGSVRTDGLGLDGTVGKGIAVGKIGQGGTAVRIESRSGSIRVEGR